ncbi:uncharacterized protein RHIMIDRAFT_257353 [Rhizopus microsporus ATCC 52813]|uniref:Uncharacterized protein n=1 Tax=Rhizopus microsporus ATCC 52813 TaxID=1340429 RepID=A0A2G4SRG3_RHIZD|nr:uncharacterized protein RHIMIDRAFT_257353 [Rhizopus microsporus ATCC 52813]PHZ11350.1 hypothetical protein RHIMIDRAFT_257353 [Rhizopus microsporus ATCC 52813]
MGKIECLLLFMISDHVTCIMMMPMLIMFLMMMTYVGYTRGRPTFDKHKKLLFIFL